MAITLALSISSLCLVMTYQEMKFTVISCFFFKMQGHLGMIDMSFKKGVLFIMLVYNDELPRHVSEVVICNFWEHREMH